MIRQDSDWLEQAQGLVAAGQPCVLVTVAGTRGSTPRETGARMLVWADGTADTIGGGRLELAAIAQARRLLAPAAPALLEEVVTLGPDVGQCCGGQVRLRFERLAAASQSLLAGQNGQEVPLDLYLFGAGHVGKAVVRALAPLPFRVTWIDSRPEMFPARIPPRVTVRHTDAPPLEAGQAPPDAFFLVMTHSHLLDLDICAHILARNQFSYLGLIGSETKRARFASRLKAIGIPPQALGRLTCPIGVSGISSKHPAAIAASVAAQLLIVAEHRRQAIAPRAAVGAE